jgi:hypothetical protein
MQRQRGDMWSAWDEAGLFLITTNSCINQRGELVMGRGIARQAKEIWPKLPKALGRTILEVCGHLGEYGLLISDRWPLLKLGAFQVKRHWREKARLSVLQRSAEMLGVWAEAHPKVEVHLNFPGIGHGGLLPQEVLPFIEVLPDNVHVWVSEEFPDVEGF